MTSLNATEDRIKGIEAGADDFLTKPVNERELMARIKTTLKLKRAVDDEIGDLRRMGDHLAKFVPDAVKRLVSANPTSPDLQKREQDVSVMFVDISGYTRLSEKIAPEVLNLLVERYFSKFLDRIHDNDGEVSETAGDGLMAIFQDGDPKRHADKAINTALTMLEDSAALNQENTIQPMDIHIGVNSGLALVGSTKFQGRRGARWVFTADGSVTNLAARLANVAKEGELVAGPETIGRLDDRYPLESLGSERLKNIDEPVEIFRILGPPSTKRNRLDDTAVSSPPPTDRATQPRRHPIAENGGPTPNTATTTDPVSSAGPELESGNGGLPWPDDYQDLKPLIHESWDIGDDLYLNRMLSGKSGALVYAADVTSRDFGGQAILKLDRLTRHGRSEAEESERHRQAIEASPDYAARHLPSIVHTCQHDGKIAILSTIAARGLEYAHPWTECPYDRQLTSVQRLSRELLEDWNTGYAFAAGMKTPSPSIAASAPTNRPSCSRGAGIPIRLPSPRTRIHCLMVCSCGQRPATYMATFMDSMCW
jgi:class 3 adenylate cyclase